MRWIEKRPKDADAGLRKAGEGYQVRVRFKLPDGRLFARELTAGTKAGARRLRDDVYAAYNAEALDVLAGSPGAAKASPGGMALRQLAEKCRHEWWPARGRSPDVAEQYFQKLRDYVFPVIGEATPIEAIVADDWDRVLAHLRGCRTGRSGPLGTGTIRKVKAVLSSALSCAVANKRLAANPIKGIAFDPNPLAEADRLGVAVEDMDDEESPAKRMLTDAEAAAILAGARGTCVYPLAALQLGFGLRVAEALAVRWGDVDAGTGEVRVRAQVRRRLRPGRKEGDGGPRTVLQRVPVLKSKAARREILALPDAAALLATLERGPDAATLASAETGGLLEPRSAQRAFRSLVEGLMEKGEIASPRPTTHSMRSWRLSHLANVVGLPASHLMRLAGHSRIETTMLYYVRSDRESLSRWLAESGRGSARSPLDA